MKEKIIWEWTGDAHVSVNATMDGFCGYPLPIYRIGYDTYSGHYVAKIGWGIEYTFTDISKALLCCEDHWRNKNES